MADKNSILLVDSLASIKEFNSFFKNKKVLCACKSEGDRGKT